MRVVDHERITTQGVGAGNHPVVAALTLGLYRLVCGRGWVTVVGGRGPGGRVSNILGRKLDLLSGGGVVSVNIGRYSGEIQTLGNAQVGPAGMQI